MRYDEVLAAVDGRARAHLDLKFTSPDEAYDDPGATYEVAAVRRAARGARRRPPDRDHRTTTGRCARSATGPTPRATSCSSGCRWAARSAACRGRKQVRVRLSELLPRLRYRESRANLVVAQHMLARLGVAAFARRRHLPLLVWTVDTEKSLRYWLRPGRAWLVTTNQPGLALRIRGR